MANPPIPTKPTPPAPPALPVPPRRWLRTNKNAASLALLTVCLLIPGLLLPFVTSNILGQQSSYSVISGVDKLWDDGKTFLAVLIFCFSVIFPIVKALFLLLATSSFVPLGNVGRSRLAHLAITTGKYSLLDLLIVALLVVIVQLEDIAEVEPQIGTLFFGSAVLVSMLAGLCVHFPTTPPSPPNNSPTTTTTPQPQPDPAE